VKVNGTTKEGGIKGVSLSAFWGCGKGNFRDGETEERKPKEVCLRIYSQEKAKLEIKRRNMKSKKTKKRQLRVRRIIRSQTFRHDLSQPKEGRNRGLFQYKTGSPRVEDRTSKKKPIQVPTAPKEKWMKKPGK